MVFMCCCGVAVLSNTDVVLVHELFIAAISNPETNVVFYEPFWRMYACICYLVYSTRYLMIAQQTRPK